MIGSLLSSKAAAVAIAITAVTGSAAAATGVLPGAESRDDTPAVTSDEDSGEGGQGAHEQGDDNSQHVQAVSHLATKTDLTGREKGAAISALASGGKSQGGQEHGQEAEHSADDHGTAEHPGAAGSAGEQGDDPQDEAAHAEDHSAEPGSESPNPND